MTIAKTPANPVETTSEKIDDASITAEVKSSLLSHRSTSALHTTVSTTDGVVTLSGIAKNDAEKSLVTKLVTDINGVTLAIILLVLWALGLVSSYTLGGFIHILLVVAIIIIIVNLISSRKRE